MILTLMRYPLPTPQELARFRQTLEPVNTKEEFLHALCWLDEYDEDGIEGGVANSIVDETMRRLDSYADVQSYDGRSIAALVRAHPDVFREVAIDPRGQTAALPSEAGKPVGSCNSFGLWKVEDEALEAAIVPDIDGKDDVTYALNTVSEPIVIIEDDAR